MTITLTANSTGDTASNGAPFIDVLYVDSFSTFTGASTFTMWRSAAGRIFRVRGLVQLPIAAGTFTVRDFEAGLGVTSTYYAEVYNAAGLSLGFTTTVAATLTDPASGGAWFHNALDPSTSVFVKFSSGAGADIGRGIDAEVFRIPGRSVGVSMFSGSRRGVEGLVLDCYTTTTAQADAFDDLFGEYDDDGIPILCIRAPSTMRFPATLFALVVDLHQLPFDVAAGGQLVQWALKGDEITPPPESLVVALLDYGDFSLFYSAYSTFTAAYASYIAATRDYSIAGYE